MSAKSYNALSLDGHTVTTPWSLCCVHVHLINCVSCIS